jgi:hypothetical protein
MTKNERRKRTTRNNKNGGEMMNNRDGYLLSEVTHLVSLTSDKTFKVKYSTRVAQQIHQNLSNPIWRLVLHV